MRTTQKDAGHIMVSGVAVGGAVVNGSGVAAGGGNTLPFTVTRTATGDYTVNFDSAVTPTAITLAPTTGQVALISLVAGAFRVQCFNTTGTLQNATPHFTLTGRDRR